MGFLVRMISRSKWEVVSNDIEINDYPSHPVMADLKTDTNNRLSVWCIDSLEDVTAIENIAVALCVARDKICKVEMLLMPEDELKCAGFKITNDPDSAQSLEEYNHMHRDIAEMKFECVGNFAQQIVKTLENKNNYRSFSAPRMKTLIKERIQNNEINTSFFKSKDRMKDELGII